MEHIKTKRKKIIILCLASACLSGLIFILFTALNKIAPFGDLSVIRNDALHQYVPFLADFIQKIKSGSSLLYSWSTGGTNEFALIAYYVLSPFNLIALPFSASNADIAFWFIILVKTMCIGLTASYYFQKKFDESDVFSVVFALVYTFSGFYIAYYYNTMWLDALIMLPLIALGIENIVNGKKATLYFLSLAYAIFVNFYLGYMICIFSVLYFFYLLFAKDVTRNAAEKDKDELPISNVLIKYGFASLLAGLSCAVVVLPVLYAISNTLGRADFQSDSSLFNFLDFISFHLTSINPPILETTTDTVPYAMSSILTLLTIPVFFCLKNIKPNKKVATAVILVIFYFSFAIPKMNYFWHGFSAPNGLPYRFVFLYLWFIITIAYEVVKNIKEAPLWSFGISAALATVAMVYTKFTRFGSHFSTKVIVISAIMTAAYLLLLILIKKTTKGKRALCTILSVVIVAEIILGNYASISSAGKYEEFFPYFNQMQAIDAKLENKQTKGFNRIEIVKDNYEIYNGSALYGYSGISSFSSLDDSDYDMTQRMLGNEGNMFSKFVYCPQTPIFNSIFAINYIFDADNSIGQNSPFYEKIDSFDNATLYHVKYTLPFGYCVDQQIEDWDPYNFMVFSVHNMLWNCIQGTENRTALTIEPVNVDCYNCIEVPSENVSEYLNQRIADGTLSEKEEESEEHNHVHDEHSIDEPESNEDSKNFEFNAQTLGEIASVFTDLYFIKATADDFYVDFNYVAQNDGEVFALVNSGSMETLTITREDGTSRDISIKNRHLSDVGYFKTGEKYTLTVKNPDRAFKDYNSAYAVTDSIQMSVASINEEKFLEGYNKILENGTLQVEEFEDTYIYGTVNSTVDGYMMMPMPYDLGWTIWVDGEEVEPYEHESHIMMFPISTGEHTVEMKYFPQGLKEGIFVSLAAILGLVLVLLLGKVHKMKLEFEAEEAKENAEKADEAAEVKNEETESNATEADSGKKEE